MPLFSPHRGVSHSCMYFFLLSNNKDWLNKLGYIRTVDCYMVIKVMAGAAVDSGVGNDVQESITIQ